MLSGERLASAVTRASRGNASSARMWVRAMIPQPTIPTPIGRPDPVSPCAIAATSLSRQSLHS